MNLEDFLLYSFFISIRKVLRGKEKMRVGKEGIPDNFRYSKHVFRSSREIIFAEAFSSMDLNKFSSGFSKKLSTFSYSRKFFFLFFVGNKSRM